jgi:hypothetical protein
MLLHAAAHMIAKYRFAAVENALGVVPITAAEVIVRFKARL